MNESNKKLNIVLLTGSNPYNNAGILAYDALKSLISNGHSVILITPFFDSRFEYGMHSIFGYLETKYRKIIAKVKFRLFKSKLNPKYYMHSLREEENYISTGKILKLLKFKPDVFIYLFPHNFLNAQNLFELNKTTGAPICVMPVDMGQITGGCHYAWDCEGFMHNCGNCPGIYSIDKHDKTFQNLTFKRNFISKTNLFVMTNTWTANLIKKSAIYHQKPIYGANVVIDEKIYAPGNKKAARDYFNIPLDKKVIFFGASNALEERKGFSYLLKAFSLLFDEMSSEQRDSVVLVVAGSINPEIKNELPFHTCYLGHLSHDHLPKAYQLADVFVSPSIQDAGPMMVIQSMMCGTPVVAFEMGNSIDFIINGVTGYSVSLGNFINLKDGIYKVLFQTIENKNNMSMSCREIALKNSSYSAFERSFISGYLKFNSKEH